MAKKSDGIGFGEMIVLAIIVFFVASILGGCLLDQLGIASYPRFF